MIEERVVGTSPLEAIIAAVKQVESERRESSGFTTRELASSLGRSRDYAQKMIRKLFDAGRVRQCGVKPFVKMNGESASVPCYELIATSSPRVGRPARASQASLPTARR